MINVFWMLLANGAVLLGSRRLVSVFGTGRPAADTVLFLIFRLLLISAVVLLAGAFRALTPWVLGLAGTVAAALLIARGTHREFLPVWKIPNCPAIYLLSALAIRMLLQTWFLSPFLGDVTSYHLPKVAEWVTKGTIFVDGGPDPRAWFPAGFELIEAWWVVFLHHDVLIEMAGIEFLALGAASAALIASRLGLSLPASLLAAAVYASVPGMMIPSVFALNDPASAATIVATAALLFEQVHPALLLTAVGLGLGIKPTYGFAAPGLLLLWFWLRKSRELLRRASPAPRAIWAVAVLALAIGSVWYLRNTVVFGNPIYPAGTDALVFGEKKQLDRLGPSPSKFARNLSDLLDRRILDNRNAVNGMVENIAGWGVGAFAFGLVGLLAACRTSRPWGILAAGFSVSLVSILALSDNDPWVMRFILFFPAILSVAAAHLTTEIRGLMMPLVVLTGLNLVGTVFTEDLPMEACRRVTESNWKDRSLASEWIPDVPFKRVGCYGDISSMAYLLYGPDLSRTVYYLRPSTADELIRSMQDRQLSALYATSKYDRNGWGARLDECVRSGRLRQLQGPWYVLTGK
jgi:hypothetical protein